jgi:hypothetical protein
MADTSSCLSDAAKSVIERTITRLQGAITDEQIVAMRELVAEGQFFDVEALVALADVTTQSSEATHGN